MIGEVSIDVSSLGDIPPSIDNEEYEVDLTKAPHAVSSGMKLGTTTKLSKEVPDAMVVRQ